jgi:hypothetical protein
MARKFAGVVLIALAAVAAAAQGNVQARSGSISGMVRDSAGKPVSGVSVMIFSDASPLASLAQTGADGRFLVRRLVPATYQIQAVAPDFLPALRQNVKLSGGAHLIVNVTLNTIVEAIQWLPPRKDSKQDDEDWKWTLRSAGNRPVLRVVDGSPVVVSSSDKPDDHTLKARVAFLTSSESRPFSQSGEMTAFNVERSLFSSGTLSFKGDLGYNWAGGPWTVMRAAYSHEAPDGSKPEIALTVRNFRSPSPLMPEAGLQALALSVANTTALMDWLEFEYGGELQAINFLGRANAVRPFGAMAAHLGPQMLVEYRYTTSRPSTRLNKGFDTAPADLSESDPRVSLMNGVAQLERARHQELSVSRRLGEKTTVEVAGYTDHVGNLVVTGVGDITQANDDILPDATSGTFATNGGTFDARGVRVVVQRRILPERLTATVDYSFGGALDLAATPSSTNGRPDLHSVGRQSVAWKLEGRAPRCGTRWIASYTWVNGRSVTPVDMFNASPGQTDPYLSFFVRQPVPSFLPVKLEALVDVRNLLAQGYIPVLGRDGDTLYLVQAARSVRGGLAFNF